MYLFEAGRHAPAAGLHDAVVAAHVLADLPVLFAPLFSAGQHRRVTEKRRNTVTGQSGSSGREGGKEGRREGREKRSQALAPGPASSETQREEETERRLCWGEAAAGDAEQSLPESPVTFPFLFFRMYYRKFHNILYSMKQFV